MDEFFIVLDKLRKFNDEREVLHNYFSKDMNSPSMSPNTCCLRMIELDKHRVHICTQPLNHEGACYIAQPEQPAVD